MPCLPPTSNPLKPLRSVPEKWMFDRLRNLQPLLGFESHHPRYDIHGKHVGECAKVRLPLDNVELLPQLCTKAVQAAAKNVKNDGAGRVDVTREACTKVLSTAAIPIDFFRRHPSHRAALGCVCVRL